MGLPPSAPPARRRRVDASQRGGLRGRRAPQRLGPETRPRRWRRPTRRRRTRRQPPHRAAAGAAPRSPGARTANWQWCRAIVVGVAAGLCSAAPTVIISALAAKQNVGQPWPRRPAWSAGCTCYGRASALTWLLRAISGARGTGAGTGANALAPDGMAALSDAPRASAGPAVPLLCRLAALPTSSVPHAFKPCWCHRTFHTTRAC